MPFALRTSILLTPLLASLFLSAQTPSSIAAEPVIRIGVAELGNESRRLVNSKWEEQQLVRELKSLRTARNSGIVLDAVPLEKRKQKDAIDEGVAKNCDYVVVTTVVEPRRPGSIAIGPPGTQPGPQIIGNVDPHKDLAIRFSLLKPGEPRPVAEGFATSPDDSGSTSDTAAADDAIRSIARQVASELRKQEGRAPQIN